MTFFKLGENVEITKVEATDSCVHLVDEKILTDFHKTAQSLKKVAPKANDFLYFVATMMHSAEASAINDDGTPKLTRTGEPVVVGWDTSNNTWRWKSNDSSIKPYKNSRGDIFPEPELIKAHKKWVHKPLCIDHESSSVDHIRGFIVDTYYDYRLKRVVALCALDKKNYPDLARKVSTGYSHCVSMGTGVQKAICTDCATVARNEHEFCDHMRRKSGYGEINVDLMPIELSIVVNGADPKAKIKHVLAAANTMNSYLENRADQLAKMASNYTAILTINSTPGENNKSTQFTINTTDLETFQEEIKSAFDKLKEFKDADLTDANDLACNQSSGSYEMNESELSNTDSGLAPPHNRYASADDSAAELREVSAAIEAKLSQMQQSLDKLSSKITQEENNMPGSNDLNKKAYFQGTEEPTPGQPKYPKDPTNEKAREEDKHMVGESPFPDTGPTDGLHPGDLDRKKMLARAAAEERALKRAATLNAAKDAIRNKQAYFQGGGGVNEPTPGKTKYPADKLNEQAREEDKHMVGQKPFPGVGSVDGMHPSPASADVSDEKKRKEMLSRASLRARFVKAANDDGSQNIGNSAWVVYLGDKKILTASVNELSGGRSEMLYDSIATEEFGGSLIRKIKANGVDRVRNLIKMAQEAAPAPAEPAPAAAPAAAPVEAAPPADAAPAEDTGGDGDPAEQAKTLVDKAVDVTSDLKEAINALVGEQAEMGDVGGLGAVASEDATLNTIRKELNVSLTDAMKKTVAQLESNKEELDMIVGLYDSGKLNSANKDLVSSVAEDAINEAKTSVADGFRLLSAFVKYARGTKAIVKRAEIEAELNALAEGDSMDSDEKDSHSSDDDLLNLINNTNKDIASLFDGDDDDLDSPVDDVMDPIDSDDDHEDEQLVDSHDLKAKPEELKDLNVKPGTHIEVAASFDSKSGRDAMRQKLAAETVKFNPILHDAHPKGGTTIDLDVKPEGDNALVEDGPEAHSAMLDLANAPPKVRKEAEAIRNLISEGRLDPNDLDALVANGADKDAVAYYKKFYAQVDGGSEFASELVKEHVKAQLEEELNNYKHKIARAYELAYDMVNRGLCHYDMASIAAQVEDIMHYNDESFNSLKKLVAKSPVLGLQKQAGKIPQVGVFGNESSTSDFEGSLVEQLSNQLNSGRKLNF